MDPGDLRALVESVHRGEVTPDDAVARLRSMPYTDLGFARVDHHRSIRQGRPEAVYAPGKSTDHIIAIIDDLIAADDGGPIIVSRANASQLEAVGRAHPGGSIHGDPDGAGGATLIWRERPSREDVSPVVVVTAGTADLPVAGECAAILEAHGLAVTRINDAGVAGIQRILDEVETLQSATAVVVVAGMEGALSSVVGGLTGAPVIAVPTSVGYGSGLQGVTALLAMTAACASGITVVGIDNGFGAACAVLRLVFTLDVAARVADAARPDTSLKAVP